MYDILRSAMKETTSLVMKKAERQRGSLMDLASQRIFESERGKPINGIAQLEKGPLEYRVVGQGPAALVLNGGHTNCNSPLGHEQFFLDQGCQLVIPSRPGYGKTPSATGRTAEAFADALVGLLDHLHLERVIVLGISG